ncbi:unnamed protein product, partial [Closterium sp. Naga37s-1]
MAGKGAAVIARGWQLEQLVLTWSIEDIFNDELLQEKVRPIPSTFADVPSYLSAFRWPLLEECRAGLKRGLEQLSATASTRVVVRAVQRSGDRRAARTDVCGEVERDDWQQQSVSYFGDDGCQGEVRGSSVHSSAPDEIEPPWCMAPHGQPTGRCRGQLVGAGKAHSELACCDTEGFCYVRFEVQQQQPAGGAGAAARLQWGGAARLKPTDVVLLSTVAPSGPADLLCPGVLYRLAVLLVERNSSGEDGDDNRCFRAKICTPEGSPEYQGMVGAAWYVTFLGSLATPQRVWGALHDPVLEVGELGRGGAGTVEEGMEGDWRRRMFRELLCLEQRPGNGGLRAGMKRGGGEERESASTFMPVLSITPEDTPHLLQAVSQFCTSRRLNHPQRSAVLACLRGLLSATTDAARTSNFFFPLGPISPFSSSSSFLSSSSLFGAAPPLLQLVQGPPGTGKTHTLSVLLSVALALGVRTLVCAPTNVAAAEVARRMLRLAMSPDTSSHFPGFCQAQQQQQQRHGWSSQLEKSFSTGGQLRVGDIVLLASEDRLAVDPELDLILLGEGRRREPGVFPKRKGCVCRGRVARLLGALSLQSGWRASVLTLMSFLENSADEMSRVHRAHLKMLEMRIKEDLGWKNSKTQSKKGTEGLPNLLEFFQERVAQLIDPALEGAVSLAHHLPSALLPERERVLLLQAGELLAALRHLLLCPGLSSDAVLSWLDGSHTGEEDDFEFSISSVLQETAVLLAPFENVDRGGGIKDCSSWAGRMLRLGTRGSINNQAAASATTSTSESFAISNDSTAASSSTRDARISLPQAECLFHSIRRHLKHIAKQSPAFHIPTLSSNPSAATVATQCVAGARLVLSTVSSSARALVRCSGHFPLLLLDEAAQLVEAESLVALQARGLRYAVLVGDPKQLPATVMSKVAVQGHYNRSLFERLQSTGWHAELLSVQYRMHPDISRFPSHGFYHGRIEDGPNVCQPSHCPPHLHLLFGPYRFFHVRGREERDSAAVDAGSRSVSNSVEAAVVIALLTRLSTGKEGGGAVKVGLISPYARQVELLQRAVEAKPWPSLTVEVNTVDGFQGRECDVVVVSTVRSNSSRSIGFVADPRRLNVAITRARHALWVVGDAHTLQRGDNMWAQLVQDAERRGCLVEAGSDEGLARAVERRWVQVGEAQQLLKPHSGLWVGLHWECSAGCRFDPRCSVCTLSPPFPPFPSSAPRFLLSAPLRRASRPPAAHYRQAEFSQEFQRSMRQAPSLEVINAVRRLMQGHRPQWDTRPRHELSDPRYHDIIHVQPVGRAFLIWTIIKVWDVVPERGVLPWLHRLAKGLASFSDQRLDCCAASAPGSARRVRPRQFSRHAPFEWWRGQQIHQLPASHPELAAIPERAPVDENVLLMKFYPLSLGSAQHLMAAVPGEWLFKLNEQQAEIVHSNCTAFVLGRSGTGKTTVITHRLLLLEHTFRRAMGERRLLTHAATGRSSAWPGREQGDWGTCEEIEESEGDEDEGKSGGEGEEERGGLRQVVVTPSARLCAAIKHYVNKATRTMLQAEEHGGAWLPNGRAGRGEGEKQSPPAGEEGQDELLLLEEAEEKLLGDLPEALDSVAPAAFPLVLTFKKLLSMVNATLSHPFQMEGSSTGSGWGRGGSMGGRWSGNGLPGGMIAVWDEENDEDDYSEDEDEEEDEGGLFSVQRWRGGRLPCVGGSTRASTTGIATSSSILSRTCGSIKSSSGTAAAWASEVDYERFEAVYWPRLNAATTRHLDASAVFKEIFSHIKGSLHALRTPHGRVSLQDYVLLARTRTSSLNEEQRAAVYGLFLQYERLKRQRGDHDMCDYVFHVYKQLEKGATRLWTPAAAATGSAYGSTSSPHHGSRPGVSSTAIGTSRAVGGGGKVVAGPPFQYVYVDEVQDLTQAQIAMLQFLCSNVACGFFFAGDTAQTIARGVDFRFQDIRRLFYELFLGKGTAASVADGVERSEEVDAGRGEAGGGVSGREIVESGGVDEAKEGRCGGEKGGVCEKQGRWARAIESRGRQRQSARGKRIQEEVRGEGSAGKEATVLKPCAAFSKGGAGTGIITAEAAIDKVAGTRNGGEEDARKGQVEDRSSCTEMPDLLFLSQNFRSHSGIVRVADSVVRLLLHFFPHSVDRLQPEFSQQQGEPPVFLQSTGSRDRVAQLFGKRGGIGGGGCEFGAEQVIIVRDAARRTELVERTGLRGLVLSVHECKGLEFQDALIYNFFSHSLLASGWRLLYEYMRQHHLIPSTAQSSSSSQWQCPAFDPRRHNLMCSELKQLYVVLTRARQRLWIYEEDEAARQPAMDLWEAMGLVVVRPLTTDLIASMHTESSPEKWHKRGLEMFNAGQFEAAKMSFERAGDERRAAVAQAALLQQTAKRLQGTDHWRACRTFLEAAQAFLAVDRPRDAAGCLASAGEMERAAAATYRNMCKPPQWEKAAACYLQAGKGSDAAECLAQAWLVEAVCSQARLYNLGLSLIHSWQAQIADGLRAVKGKDKQEQHQSQHWVSGDMCGSSSNGLVPPLSVNSAGGGGTFASSLESARWEGESAQKVARESSTAACAPGEGETWKMRQGLVTRLSSDFLCDAAKFFYRKKDRGKMMKYVLRFPAAAEKRRFLERRDLFEELLQVEVAEGNFEQAATAKLKKGDMLGAAEMFVQQTMWGRAFDCAMEAARVASMWANGNNGWPLNCSSSMRREGGEEQEEEEDKEVGECAQVTTGRNDGWSWRSEVRKWIGRGAAARVEGVGEEGQKSWSGGSRNALELAVAIWLTQEEASVCRGAGMVAGFVTREGERGSGKEARRLARSQHMGGSAEQGEGAREGEREVDAEQGLEALTLLLLSEWIQLKGGTGDMETLWCQLTSWERGRSIAAEVLCSWKALELSVEKFNLLSHTTSSLSAAPPLTSTAAPLPNTEHLPSRIPVLRQPQPVQASVGGWRRPLGGGGQQGMQQVQQGVRSEQPRDESWPGGFQQLVAQVEEVQRWWGEWSERAARMLAALQRLCRRREVPADQPWLDAAFHLLAATPPTASSTAGVVSTAAHTAPPTLDLPTHSILVGLSCASWLLPVRAAVTRLPNQGTRGEVAREAAAEAGAIYWSRQVVAVVQGCLQVLDVAMCRTSVALQQMGRGNELMLRGMGRQLPGPVVAQGGCKVHNFQQQQQQGAAREGISHAALLRLQCKWLVQYLEMLERALQCCNGATKASQRPHGHSTTDRVSSKEGNGHKSAEARELEGAASMLERLQDSLARRLLQHVMPVGAPLPRDVALLAAEERAQESTAFALHCWALRLLAQCVDGATRQDPVTRDKEGVVWGSIGLGSDMHEPVLLALLGDLLLVLPLLGTRWVHRHGGELLQRQSSLPPVHAAVLRAVVHEDAVRLFLEQRHSHGAAVTLASTESVAALLEALTVSLCSLFGGCSPGGAHCSEYQLKSQLTRLHGVIKSLLQQQGALQQQWGSSSDAAGDSTPHFLRLLTLLLASSANVPAFHNSTAAFL